MATATRRGNSTRQFTRPKKAAISADKLAEQLSSGLTISNAKGKQKASADGDVRLSAMCSVNSASQALSTALQSGWKSSLVTAQSKSSPSLSNVTAAAVSAAKHLAVLRTMCPKDVDVERAAVSVLTKLVALEMVCFCILV